MPLSKKRDRARKRIERASGAVQPVSNLMAVQPIQPDLKAKLEKVGLKVGVDGILDATGLTRSPLKQAGNSNPPLYNKHIHKQGDRVRMAGSNIEVIVPELDAEGNPVSDY